MTQAERPHLYRVDRDAEGEREAPPPSSPHLELGDRPPRTRHRARPADTERARKDAIARVLLLVGVSALVAVVIGPRLVGADLPGEGELGKPARVHVRADRDYALIDRDATETRARAARQASRSVWDLDLARAQQDARVLDGALERVEQALERERAVRSRPEGREGARAPLPAAEPAEPAAPLDDDAWAALEDVRAKIAGELALVGAEAPRDEDWRALVRATWRFPRVPAEITAAVREALSAPVVGDRALLALDEARGIVVRPVPAALRRGERVIETTDEVRDLEQARLALSDELRQRLLAAAPGLPDDDAARIAASWSTLLRTTLTYNATESELRRQEAADNVPPELVRVRRGEMVLRPGEVIERRHLVVLAAMQAQRGDEMRTRAALGTGAFVLFLCFVVYRFGVRGVFCCNFFCYFCLYAGMV